MSKYSLTQQKCKSGNPFEIINQKFDMLASADIKIKKSEKTLMV